MPLNMAENGDSGTIVRITGQDSVRQHLAELGFVVGTAVTVLSRIAGNVIVCVKDSRVALDKAMAGRILVELHGVSV